MSTLSYSLTERADNITTVALSGSIDSKTLPVFETMMDRMVEEERLKVIVNMHDLAYINSTGLGMLVQLFFSLKEEGGGLVILGGSKKAMFAFEILGLQEVLPVADSEEDAAILLQNSKTEPTPTPSAAVPEPEPEIQPEPRPVPVQRETILSKPAGRSATPSATPKAPVRKPKPSLPDHEYPLILRKIKRGYQTGPNFVEVLRGLDLTVRPGEIVILAGPSGSGKSTLLSVAGGLLSADSGELLVFGEDITKLKESEMQKVRQKSMGYIFQNIYLMSALTARENISIAFDIKGRGNAPDDIEDRLLDLVDMQEFAGQLPSQLSGGQKQRVAIARSLAGSPKIIFADEPTAALDTKNALSVMKLLRDLTRSEGLATIIVTHDTRLFDYADRVMLFNNGKIRERKAKKREVKSRKQ